MPEPGSVTKVKTGKKRAKNEKPSFETFIVSLQEALERIDKKALGTAVNLLKTGYADDHAVDGRVDDIVSMLREWKLVGPLAVRLSQDCRFGKMNALTKIVWNRLRVDFIREIGYPTIPLGEGSVSRQPISEWIRSSLNPLPTDPDDWFRRAYVCLLGEGEIEDIREYLYELLDNHYLHISLKGKPLGSADKEYLSQVAASLWKSSSLKGPLKLMALAARPARNVIQTAINSAKRSREDLMEARQRIHELGGRLETLQEELAEARTSIVELGKKITDKEAELLSETDRCHATEVHWREVLKADTAQLKSRIRERLSHEISEAELCLDREVPNASMALDRIRRIRTFLDNLGG